MSTFKNRRRLEGLADHPWLGAPYRTLQRARRDHAQDMAAAIAFYSLFSIFPLLIGAVALAGYLLDDSDAQAKIYQFVDGSFPGSSGLVRANIESIVQRRGAIGMAGATALLWSATAAFGAMTRCINHIWGAESSRPFYLSKPRSFLMTVAVTVLLLASVLTTAVVELLADIDLVWLERLGLDLSGSVRLQAWGVSLGSTFLIFMLLYKVVPYARPGWRQVLPGAILATVLFEIGKALFLIYLDRAADLEAIYGPLSSIIVLLVWLYVSAMVLIVGAEFIMVRAES